MFFLFGYTSKQWLNMRLTYNKSNSLFDKFRLSILGNNRIRLLLLLAVLSTSLALRTFTSSMMIELSMPVTLPVSSMGASTTSAPLLLVIAFTIGAAAAAAT